MDLVPPNILDRRRVKVYELKSNDWYDRGTGFCAGRVVNVRRPPRLSRFAACTELTTAHRAG